MSNYNKTGKYCKCNWCDKKLYRAGWQLKKSKTGIFYCGRECTAKGKQSEKIKEIEKKLDISDFKKWLTEKYHNDKLSAREIAKLVYGKPKNSPNILSWMDTFGIESRERSEAVTLQWVDNDERRKWQSNFAKVHLSDGTPAREALIKVMQTDEYRYKNSVLKRGNKNPMWNPNLTDEERKENIKNSRLTPGYNLFRRYVYERDNYTCKVCGDSKGNNLVVHHLNGYHWDKLNRTEVSNGVTLCTMCHNEFHRMYGRKDVNLFQFSQFLEYKQQASNN